MVVFFAVHNKIGLLFQKTKHSVLWPSDKKGRDQAVIRKGL